MEEKLICSSGEDSTFPAPRSRLPLCFISALSGIHFPTVRQPPAAPSLGPDSGRRAEARRQSFVLNAEALEVRREL